MDIKKLTNFKPLGYQRTKKQIILCHTSREVKEYLTSLEFRDKCKLGKIPNFIVDRNGEVTQLLPETAYSDFFTEININRNSIIISLENLGWLEKKPLSEEYISWKGNIYNGVVYQKKWRDYTFWHPYTESQLKATASLCDYITKDLKIKKNLIGHNTKVDGVERYEGIVSRSNFDSKFTDLNPSFDFNLFAKQFNNE
jgi:N-acetyl-anhydromuramyl-L-alanine amidase AmpD